MQVKNYEAKVSQDLKDILVATSNRRIIGIDQPNINKISHYSTRLASQQHSTCLMADTDRGTSDLLESKMQGHQLFASVQAYNKQFEQSMKLELKVEKKIEEKGVKPLGKL